MRGILLLMGGIGLTVSMTFVASARAAEGEPATSTPKATYLKYCGACHGPEGKGDGIAGTFMRPKPVDLTQIAKQNGGQFPAERTMEVIDGRKNVRAHGDPDMPVWGEVLAAQETDDLHRRAMVKATLTLITDYVASIQAR